jgi:hypothetical protein
MKKPASATRPAERRAERDTRDLAAFEKRFHRPLRIFDRFSREQQIQISRLTRAGEFEDADGSPTFDWTIVELAAVGLYVLGLDRLSEDAVSRLSKVVYGEEKSFEADLFNAINDEWGTAEAWTKQQRRDELAESLKGRAA